MFQRLGNRDTMLVRYRWQSENPNTHYFRVTLSISGHLPAQAWNIWMPVWTPGSYLVREFSRHIHGVRARVLDDEGNVESELDIEKTAKNRWQVETPRALKNESLSIEYLVYAFDPSVRTAYFDFESLGMDGAAVWLSIEGTEALPRTVSWDQPSPDTPWSLATALKAETIDDHGFGTYQADNYLQQTDSPAMAGRHLKRFSMTVDNTPHTIVFDDAASNPETPLDLDRLQQDMTTVCHWNHTFWPGGLPFSHYVTLTHVQANNYGGLEHAESTRLVCSRYDLPRKGIKTDEDNYSKFLGLFSHEYFHSWWVKRLRPHTLVPYSLEAEQYTPLLWMFEGFTAYFDDLSLVQCGLVSSEQYLKNLASLLDRVRNTPAHARHSLQESSFDAWIRAYRPDENTPNSTVSYYDQGAVLALVMDLTLIQHGSSLQEVLATLWETHFLAPATPVAGLTEQDLIRALKQHAPDVNWSSLIKRDVHTPILPDYKHALTQCGISLSWTTPSTTSFMAQRLGVRFKERSLVISHVLHDRSAAQSGVHVGDEWLALNGEQLSAANWVDVFTRLDNKSTQTNELHFFREGRLKTLPLNGPVELALHQLQFNPTADATQKQAFARWLHLHGNHGNLES